MATIFDLKPPLSTISSTEATVGHPGSYGGVFGNFMEAFTSDTIAMSPKYNTNNRSVDSMARLFIPLSSAKARTTYLDSINNGGKGDAEQNEARRIAKVLAVESGKFGGASGSGYIDFLLTNVQESYAEKVQISEVLSDNFIAYFFGASPPVFNYTGMLYNTLQNDWRSAFSILYHQVIRGTQLARRKVSLCLAYDNVIVTGAMLNMTQSLDATQQMASPFSFSLLVKQYYVWRPENSPITQRDPTTGFLLKESTKSMLAGLGNIVSVSSAKLPASQIVLAEPARSTEPAAQADAQQSSIDDTIETLAFDPNANTTQATPQTKQAKENMYPPPTFDENDKFI